jgi:hypothetical protein
VTDKYMEKCSTPLAIKEMQIEMTQISSHLKQNISHQETRNADEDAGKKEP